MLLLVTPPGAEQEGCWDQAPVLPGQEQCYEDVLTVKVY
jgi:hypothetical protein